MSIQPLPDIKVPFVDSAGWSTRWTGCGNGRRTFDRVIQTAHTDKVRAVATTEVNGRPVAVTTGNDRTVRVWDLTTVDDVAGAGVIESVATGTLHGRQVAITAGADATIRVWDLDSGDPVGSPLIGHAGPIHHLAATMVDQQLAVLSAGADGALRSWDPATGQQTGTIPAGDPADEICALDTVVVDGRPIAVTAGTGKTIHGWDLTTGTRLGSPPAARHRVRALAATTTPDGRPIAVSGTLHGGLRVRDLHTGHDIAPHPTGRHGKLIREIALTTGADGTPLALTTSADLDEAVKLWDVTTGHLIGELPVHGVQALAATVVDGHPVAITGAKDTVAVWDLTALRQIGPATKALEPVTALALTPAGHLIICARRHITVMTTDPRP
ncbi:WD40 repeat domain-containing protein [Nonomuraea sp. CA-143628]|uniref:WD40 repeat domain-containing protein n=1 Tax=Nonomuraea sp. CA-143628 TaxID=3239997 RepID=UPI003D9063CD